MQPQSTWKMTNATMDPKIINAILMAENLALFSVGESFTVFSSSAADLVTTNGSMDGVDTSDGVSEGNDESVG